MDTIAERAARRCGLAVEVFPADWSQFGHSAGPRRNAQIVAAAGEIVAFWDGTSRGTLNTVLQAVRAGKAVTVYGDAGQVVSLEDALAAAERLGVVAAMDHQRYRLPSKKGGKGE